MAEQTITEIRENVMTIIWKDWKDKNPKGSSRDWYSYCCEHLCLKKSPVGGWMIENEAELTMLLLKLNINK
jgi:hypothetical protein